MPWFLSVVASVALAEPPVVKSDAGLLEGIAGSAGEAVFLGIPYAAPPVRSLRWKPPQPVQAWSGVRPARSFAPLCVQAPSDVEYHRTVFQEIAAEHPYYSGVRADEDCLYLNVWSRHVGRNARRPVMVWIHGGSNIAGTGAYPPFGPKLAAKDVVFVGINYRLGAFGFLAHPDLTAESAHRSSGNYALLDIAAALGWVRRNIAAFGGDSGNVTLLGESAGAVMACYLMASPLSGGLFHRAILQSCSCRGYLSPELPAAEQVGLRLAASGQQLRAMTAAEVLRAADSDSPVREFLLLGGTVDGWVLTEQPAATFHAGRQARVPILTGSNADEGTVAASQLDPPTLSGYNSWLQARFGAHARAVLDAYPAASDAEVPTAFVALLNDYQRGHIVRTAARDAVRAGLRAYLYYFTYPPKGAYLSLGSFHGLELSFIGGGFFRRSRWGDPDARDLQFAELVSGYWTRFAATGDPNGPGAPAWPAYHPAEDRAIELGLRVGPIPVPHAARFAVLDRSLPTVRTSKRGRGK